MKEEIFKRLDQVAEKLGVAVNYLWPALVQREIASGIFAAICTLFLAVMFYKTWTFPNREDDYDAEFKECLRKCAACPIIAIGMMLYLHSACVSLLAPEASAFLGLMEKLNK